MTISQAFECASMLAELGLTPRASEWVEWVGNYLKAADMHARHYSGGAPGQGV